MGKYLSVKTGIIDNHHLLTVDMDTWQFLNWNLNTDTYHIVAEFMPDGDYRLCWVQKIVKYGNSYFFLQRNSKQLIEYCVDKKEVIRHGLEYLLGDDTCLLYCDATVLSDKLYMFPYSLDGVITIFDLKAKKYLEDYKMSSLVHPKNENKLDGKILSYHIAGNDIWFCVEKSNEVFYLNLQMMASYSMELSSESSLCRVMGNQGDVYCTEIGNRIFYKLDYTTNSFQTYNPYKNEAIKEEGYIFIVSSAQNVIAFPEKMNSMDILADSDKSVKTVTFPDTIYNIFQLRNSQTMFSQRIIQNDKLYLLPFSSSGLLEVDLMDFKMKYHCLKISHKDFIYSLNRNKEILFENSAFLLDDLFSLLEKFESEKII